jgi:uncharacterized DUF497 family protein
MSKRLLTFDFDPAKAARNLRKHGVSFREAMTVFDDPLAATFPDELHSEDEARSITIGPSLRQRLLFISHLDSPDRIRLIGARKVSGKVSGDTIGHDTHSPSPYAEAAM